MKEMIKLRKSYGFTQKEVAQEIGIKRSNYSNIEGGKYEYTDMEAFKDKVRVAVKSLASKRVKELNKKLNKQK